MLVLVFYNFMIAANGFQALKYSRLTSLSVIVVCSHTKIMTIPLHAKLFLFRFSADRSAGLQIRLPLPGGLQSAGKRLTDKKRMTIQVPEMPILRQLSVNKEKVGQLLVQKI